MSKINKIKVENTIYDVEDTTSGYITKDVNNLTNYELKVSTANNILVSINSDTYVMTMTLRNSNNEVLNTQTVDLPLETMVVGGSYDSTNKKIVLTLKNGNTIDVPVGDLINGLQSEITSTNKLDASLVDDSLSTNKFVTSAEKTNWNAKEDTSNKTTTIDNTSTDLQYASAKAIYDLVSNIGNDMDIYYLPTTSSTSPFIFANAKKGIYRYDSDSSYGYMYFKKDEGSTSTLNANISTPIFLIVQKELKDVVGNEKFALLFGFTKEEISTKSFYINTNNELKWVQNNHGTILSATGSQNIGGTKIFNAIPQQNGTTAPTQNNEFTNKKYVDDKPTTYTGYDATKTQVLKNINGTLTWVDE